MVFASPGLPGVVWVSSWLVLIGWKWCWDVYRLGLGHRSCVSSGSGWFLWFSRWLSSCSCLVLGGPMWFWGAEQRWALKTLIWFYTLLCFISIDMKVFTCFLQMIQWSIEFFLQWSGSPKHSIHSSAAAPLPPLGHSRTYYGRPCYRAGRPVPLTESQPHLLLLHRAKNQCHK